MNKRQKLRQTWNDIKRRCYNPKSRDYRYYGEKGVAVSDSWLTFETFWNDMNDAYFEGATIDRIDSKGPYSLENCRWLSRYDNTSRAHKGKKLTDEHRRSISSSSKGRVYSEESITRMREVALERNRKKILCEWCNREFDPSNFKKCHGNKCKLNPINGYIPRRYLTKEEISAINKEGARKRLLIVKKCEYCGKDIDAANYAKSHGLKCKSYRGV